MKRYYDIVVSTNNNKRNVHYWADSFSISKNGILKVYSAEAGDISVMLEPTEEVTIKNVDVKEEWDDWEGARNEKQQP